MKPTRPIVMCFSGHDPSGGAGVQADIETLLSHNCHPASIITALTEQDSRNVKKLIPQKPSDILHQADTLLSDFNIAAVKIGLIVIACGVIVGLVVIGRFFIILGIPPRIRSGIVV